MSEEDLPLKLRIMMALGMAKVKVRKKEVFDDSKFDKQTMPKGFAPSYRRKNRRSFPEINMNHVILGIGLIIPALIFLPLFDSLNIDEELPLREQAKIVAESEEKDEWEKKTWDNPETTIRLQELKTEIDEADCQQLDSFFQNDGWTLRPYVAWTILERGC